MENATKALLIAAAVLIAILIISLGIMIYNQASETVNSVDMSAQEIQAFNDQFLKYQGSGKRGTEVNALLKTVVTSNNSEISKDATTIRKVTVTCTSPSISITGAQTTIPTVDTSKVYTITVNMDTKTGLVNKIDIK